MAKEDLVYEFGGVVRGDTVIIDPPHQGQSLGKALGYEYGDWAIEFENPLPSDNVSVRVEGRSGYCQWIASKRVTKLVVEILGDDDEDCV